MRDATRPAGHPLVELVHDLRDVLDQAEADGALTIPRVRLYQRMRGTLRSAHRFVDALELLVAELETQSEGLPDERWTDQEAGDDDFQRITVR